MTVERLTILESSHRKTEAQIRRLATGIDKRMQLTLLAESPTGPAAVSGSGNDRVAVVSPDELDAIRSLTECPSPEFIDLLQDRVLKDFNLPLFYDRTVRYTLAVRKRGFFLPQATDSIHHYYQRVAETALRTWLTIRSLSPDIMVFANTPHGSLPWVNSLVANALGVQILVVHDGIVPGYRRIMSGFGQHRNPLRLTASGNTNRCTAYHEDRKRYLADCRSSFEAGMASYERERLKENGGRVFNPKQVAGAHWFRPLWALNTWRCWHTMQHLAINADNLPKRYAVYFLHYQPEKTSLPEGFGFTQQINAIRALRACLPRHVHLLVKEHPASYNYMCVPGYRTPDFYRSIDAMQNVNLLDIHCDNFEVIDRAVCASTLSGTIGVEALIRGVPVVYFGLPAAYGLYGQHVYESAQELQAFLEHAGSGRLNRDSIRESIEQRMLGEADYVFQYDIKEPGQERKVAALEILLKEPPPELFEPPDSRTPGLREPLPEAETAVEN